MPQPIVKVYDLTDIGRTIRERRRTLQLTQVEAAHLSGVSQRLWSECERGERLNMSVDTLLRMLQTIGLDVALLPRPVTQDSSHSGTTAVSAVSAVSHDRSRDAAHT